MYKKEKRKFLNNLNLNEITDNKTFWKTVKPFLSNKEDVHKQITLIDGEKIISKNEDVANTLSNYFENAVKSLEIIENKEILTSIIGIDNPIDIAIKKYETHPSILLIKEKVVLHFKTFSFSLTDLTDMENELKSLNPRKATTFKNIPA